MEWIELFFLCLYIQVLRSCQLNCIAFLLNHWFCIEKSNTAGRFESFRRKKKTTLFSQFASFDCLLNGPCLLIWAIQIEMDGGWCLFLTPNWREMQRIICCMEQRMCFMIFLCAIFWLFFFLSRLVFDDNCIRLFE